MIYWDEGNIGTLGARFLQGVLGNMMKDSTVAFGQTGTGQAPNYQVILGDGKKVAHSGKNHELFQNAEEFDDKNISAPFSYETVLQKFCKARDGK